MIGALNSMRHRYAATHHDQNTGVSISVPPSGVTSVAATGGGQPQVVASTSMTSPDVPFDVDESSEVLLGQRSGQAMSMSGAAAAVERGDVGAMEFGDYGVLPDGTPAFAFTGENGKRQVVMLTSAQWLAGIEARGLARRETQFRIDATKKAEERGRAFRAALAGSGIDDTDRQLLSLMFERSPDAALKAAGVVHSARAKLNYERQLVGGQEALGGDRAEWLAENGYTPPQSMSHERWNDYWMRIMSDQESAAMPITVHGDTVPAIEAAVLEHHYTGIALHAANVTNNLNEALTQAGPQMGNGDAATWLRNDIGKFGLLARGPAFMALPEDATVFDSRAGGRDPGGTLSSLITAAVMTGQFGRPMEDLEHDRVAIEDLMSAIDRVQHSVLGWSPLTPEQQTKLMPRLVEAAAKWRSLIDDRPLRTSSVLHAEQQQLADEQLEAERLATRSAEQHANATLVAMQGLSPEVHSQFAALSQLDPSAAADLLSKIILKQIEHQQTLQANGLSPAPTVARPGHVVDGGTHAATQTVTTAAEPLHKEAGDALAAVPLQLLQQIERLGIEFPAIVESDPALAAAWLAKIVEGDGRLHSWRGHQDLQLLREFSSRYAAGLNQ